MIASFAEESAVLERLGQVDAAYIPSIVLGELHYGARRSLNIESNLRRIDELVAQSPQLTCDLGAAQHYGVIKQMLRARGRPQPENDIWVAAIALQHSLTLASRDEHFKEVTGLQLERW